MPPACVPDAVAAAALTWFAQRVAGKKHAPNEYTVLSVLVVEQDGEWTVVSGGTGTKCVGLSGLCREGYILADSHAETMCRRAFLRYLYRELDAPTADVPPIFDIVDGKRRLKSTCRMYMYISEAPCGDAALYDLHQDALDEIHESKLKRRKLDQETVTTVPCRTTGAKEAETIEHSNALGLARVKSGRSDILPENRTVSMSCSDKICKWLACGLQGNLLSQWFEPIILSGIVVSQDSKADDGSFHRALQRSVSRSRVDSCTVWSTKLEFPLRRSETRASASGMSLNWCLGCDNVEYTLGARGVKMGAKKKLDDATKRKMCSRLCRRELSQLALKHQDDAEDANTKTYGELKRANELYIQRRDAFLALPPFQAWKGVPPEYDDFTMNISS